MRVRVFGPRGRSGEPGTVGAWHLLPGSTRRSREAVARRLWDNHYAEIASGCARHVPQTAIVHAIVEEAFVQLLYRRVAPGDPLGFVVGRVTRMTGDHCRQRACVGSATEPPPANQAATPGVVDIVAGPHHGGPTTGDRPAGNRGAAARSSRRATRVDGKARSSLAVVPARAQALLD
jgi:hypothetical protein